MIIYKATNLVNGKCYIGQTVKLLKYRKSEHIKNMLNGSFSYFCNALRKYKTENFKWEIICICPNIKELDIQEQYYIKLYNSIENGYNLTSGGSRCIYSDKTKKKMSLLAIEWYKHNPGVRNGKNNGMFGVHRTGKDNPMFNKHHSLKTKETLRQLRIGKTHPKETKEKMSKSHQNISDELRAKFRLVHGGKNNGMYGKHHSKESKEKMRITALNMTQKTKDKISNSVKLYYINKKRNQNNDKR